jgi:RNA polymerase sigma-54 factor
MLKSYNQERKTQNQNRNQKEAATFVRQKVESARWFMEAIRQRQHTLILTMNAIMEFQKEYFRSGGDEMRLRPMILKDISEQTSLDISTISRVANSKYIQTDWGIFPLKYFFSEGLQTDTGEEVSTREIKKILEECLENEDKRRPVTDDKLALILKQKGYMIARRTVAKYREQLNIPVARLRKEL